MPLLTVLLILANLAAYGLELAAGGLPACEAYGLIPAHFTQTGNMAPVFTALFLHDPSGFSHLAGNMAALLLFGAVVERELGTVLFGVVYAAAGLAGGLLHVTVNPTAIEPMVGASGAIFGVMAVAACVRPRLLGFAAASGMINVWYAVTGAGEGISFGAHLGGLAAGVACAAVLRMTGVEARSEKAA